VNNVNRTSEEDDLAWEEYQKTIPRPELETILPQADTFKRTTLCEYVRSVVDSLGIESIEFKELLEFHGLVKLREMYKKGKSI
jgi:hypothetical protein